MPVYMYRNQVMYVAEDRSIMLNLIWVYRLGDNIYPYVLTISCLILDLYKFCREQKFSEEQTSAFFTLLRDLMDKLKGEKYINLSYINTMLHVY